MEKIGLRNKGFLAAVFVLLCSIMVMGGNVIVKNGQLNVSAGDLIVGDDLFVDVSEGNVGIGTTNLQHNRLHVSYSPTNDGGAHAIHALFRPAATVNGGYFNRGFSCDMYPKVDGGITNSEYAVAMYANALGDTGFAGTLDRMMGVVSHYGIYDDGTGTITNAYGIKVTPYHKSGTITNSYSLYLNSPKTGGTVTNEWALYSEDDAPSYFAGNVGIGTTDPGSSKLRVDSTDANDGSIRHTAYFTNDATISSNGFYRNRAILGMAYQGVQSGVTDTGSATGTAGFAYLNGPGTLEGAVGGNFVAGTADAGTGTLNNAYGVYSRVKNFASGSGGTITNGYGIYIGEIEATNGWGVYQANSDYNNYFAGNVGIGTASPQSILSIGGSNPVISTDTTDVGGHTKRLTLRGSGGAGDAGAIYLYGNDYTLEGNRGDIQIVAGNTGNEDISFYTDNTQNRMIIKEGGNVGIGTTSPGAKLEVAGTIVADPNYATGTRTSSWTTTSTSWTNITDLSATLTTHGKPVLITVNLNYESPYNTGWAFFTIDRDGTNLGDASTGLQTAVGGYDENQCVTMTYIDVPSAGSHTYTVQAKRGGGISVEVCENGNKAQIAVVELN